MKETENLIFFRCKIDFYFTHEHQKRYFHSWLRCSFDEIKIDLTPKKSNILYGMIYISDIRKNDLCLSPNLGPSLVFYDK